MRRSFGTHALPRAQWVDRLSRGVRVLARSSLVGKVAAIGLIATTASLGFVIGQYLRGEPAADLGPERRALMHTVVSVLEHDTPVFQYGYIEDRNDGRGYSSGRGSFSTAGGELLSVVRDYTESTPYNALTRYLPALQTLADERSDGFVGLDGFVTAWQAAAADPALRVAQDRAMDRLFVAPAERTAKDLGLRSTLGLVVFYDTAVQHGTGDGPNGLDGLVDRTSIDIGGAPSDGIGEREWLSRFLDIRRDVLLNPEEPTLQEAWARTAGRVDALRALLEAGNDELRPPLTLNPYGTPHKIVAPYDESLAPDPAALPPSPPVSVKSFPTFVTPSAAPASLVATQPPRPQATPSRPSSAPKPTNVVKVATTSALRAALAAAQPGQVISLEDGTYFGVFDITRSGTASKPITLQGSAAAVLTSTGSGLNVRASHWRLRGFTISNSLKGIMLDGAHHNVIDGVTIRGIDHEGVHFRRHSTNNTLTRSTIRDTGRTQPGWGRGVSIGSTANLWEQLTGGQPDQSNSNRIVANTFGPDLRGGMIQAAEGTVSGTIADNTFNGAGMTASAWVVVRGNAYLVTGNSGVTSTSDGFLTAVQMPGWGCQNIFRGNRADVRASGYGIRVGIEPGCSTLVYADNRAFNAGSGLTNVAVQP